MTLAHAFQILITDDPGGADTATPLLREHIASFRATYPHAEHQVFDADSGVRFLRGHFPPDVAETFERLTPFAYKADLLRYALLYIHGGVYSDLSFRHVAPIPLPEDAAMVVFRDLPGHPEHAMSIALMAARPGATALRLTIDRIVRNAQTRNYCTSSLEITGPYLFGTAIADAPKTERVITGRSLRRLRPFDALRGRPMRQTVKVMPDGTPIAFKQKRHAASVAEFIGGGGNNYNHLWRRRQVFSEPTIRLAGADPIWRRGEGVTANADESATLAPGYDGQRLRLGHLTLPSGRYALSVAARADTPGTAQAVVRSMDETRVLARTDCSPSARHPVEFFVSEYDSKHMIEVYVTSDSQFSGQLDQVELTPIKY